MPIKDIPQCIFQAYPQPITSPSIEHIPNSKGVIVGNPEKVAEVAQKVNLEYLELKRGMPSSFHHGLGQLVQIFVLADMINTFL